MHELSPRVTNVSHSKIVNLIYKLKAVDFSASNQQTRSCLAFSLYLRKLEVARLFLSISAHLKLPGSFLLTSTNQKLYASSLFLTGRQLIQNLPLFLLLFLTRLPQKCNENRCFPHFCCFFLPVFLKNATKNDAFLIFVAFSYHFLSEIQRILGFSSILLLFHFPLAQRYNKNEIFLLFCRISSPVSFSSTAKNE